MLSTGEHGGAVMEKFTKLLMEPAKEHSLNGMCVCKMSPV